MHCCVVDRGWIIVRYFFLLRVTVGSCVNCVDYLPSLSLTIHFVSDSFVFCVFCFSFLNILSRSPSHSHKNHSISWHAHVHVCVFVELGYVVWNFSFACVYIFFSISFRSAVEVPPIFEEDQVAFFVIFCPSLVINNGAAFILQSRPVCDSPLPPPPPPITSVPNGGSRGGTGQNGGSGTCESPFPFPPPPVSAFTTFRPPTSSGAPVSTTASQPPPPPPPPLPTSSAPSSVSSSWVL